MLTQTCTVLTLKPAHARPHARPHARTHAFTHARTRTHARTPYPPLTHTRNRYAKQRAERDAIRIEEEKLLAQNTVPQHPCAAELVICDDLVHHLKALLPKEEARDVQAFVPVATKDDKGKTLKPIGKIANDEGFFSAPAAKAKKTKKAEVPASEKLVHDFAVIGSFAKIKVSLPLTRGDVSACIAQIEQARAAFEARTEAEADAEERQPRAKAQGGAAEAFPVKVTVTATAADKVDVKVSVKP